MRVYQVRGAPFGCSFPCSFLLPMFQLISFHSVYYSADPLFLLLLLLCYYCCFFFFLLFPQHFLQSALLLLLLLLALFICLLFLLPTPCFCSLTIHAYHLSAYLPIAIPLLPIPLILQLIALPLASAHPHLSAPTSTHPVCFIHQFFCYSYYFCSSFYFLCSLILLPLRPTAPSLVYSPGPSPVTLLNLPILPQFCFPSWSFCHSPSCSG